MFYCQVQLRQNRIAAYQLGLICLLRDFFNVEIITFSGYDYNSGLPVKTIEILGCRAKVLLAEHMYHFIINSLESLWANFHHTQRSKKSPFSKLKRRSKNSFCCGVIDGFYQKLKAKEQGPMNQDDKVAVSTDPDWRLVLNQNYLQEMREISRFLKFRHPKIHHTSRHIKKSDAQAYEVGQSKGKLLNWSRPLTKSQSSDSVKSLNASLHPRD